MHEHKTISETLSCMALAGTLLLAGCSGDGGGGVPSGPNEHPPGDASATCQVYLTQQINLRGDSEYNAVSVSTWMWKSWEESGYRPPLPPLELNGVLQDVDPGADGYGIPWDQGLLSPQDTVTVDLHFCDGFTFHSFFNGVRPFMIPALNVDTVYTGDPLIVDVYSLGDFDEITLSYIPGETEDDLIIETPTRHEFPVPELGAEPRTLLITGIHTFIDRTVEMYGDTLYYDYHRLRHDRRVTLVRTAE